MSRINTNISSLIAQRILKQNNNALTKSLERLSTGFKINRGGDDPAGLIASERLRAEQTQVEAAIRNAERADQVLNIAEGGLQEVSNMLTELQSLVSQAGSEAGLSIDEKEANQVQIDNILSSIDRIASTTSFEGTKLLNGYYEFRASSVHASVQDYEINGAKVPDGSNVDVQVITTGSATHGSVFLELSGTTIDTGDNDASTVFSFQVAGKEGSREFTFSSGTSIDDAITSINNFKDVTGVSAKKVGNSINLQSTDFGSDQFVDVTLTSVETTQVGDIRTRSAASEDTAHTSTLTAFTSVTSSHRSDGQDIGAVVNGVTARGKGTQIFINNDALDLSLRLDSSAAATQTIGTSLTAFTIEDSGAKFNIGPTVDLGNQVRVGLKAVNVRNIGSTLYDGSLYKLKDVGSGKFGNIVTGNVTAAQKIVNEAVDEVSKLRGRIGAFQRMTIQTSINSLEVSMENLSAAESVIRDTDFAEETAALTRNQVLVQAASNALQITNSNPQNVLRLFG